MSKDSGYTALDKMIIVRSYRHSSLATLDKFLLFIIATHLGDNDFSFISIDTFQKETGICRRHTVTKHLDYLVYLGYIIKYAPSHGYKSNRYSINFDLIITTYPQDKLNLLEKMHAVPLRDYTSPPKGLDQSLTGTRPVPHRDSNKNLIGIEKKGNRKRRARPLNRGAKNQEPKPNPHHEEQLRLHEERKQLERSESGKQNMKEIFAKLGMKSKLSDDIH
jgi:hypothetical protein